MKNVIIIIIIYMFFQTQMLLFIVENQNEILLHSCFFNHICQATKRAKITIKKPI